MAANNNLDPRVSNFLATTLGTAIFATFPLAGDASSRRYVRIVCQDTSLVLMQWEQYVDDGNYPFLNILEHFKKHDVQVPRVIAKSPELGLVLLEDLGDLTLERKFWENQNQNLALPYYQQAIDELIKIHVGASRDNNSHTLAFQNEFNVEKFMWEMNYGLEHLLEKFCKIQLSANLKAELQKAFLAICTVLHNEPKIVCHRDYHSRNIMIKLGKTRIIDFQDARMGPRQYDLVSLLHDSYVDMSDSLRTALFDYYLLQSRAAGGPKIDTGQFYEVFEEQMIQRCFKACGSFSSFYNMREDRRYLKYLKPTLNKVADVLRDRNQYSVFLSVIEDNGLREMDFLNPGGVL